MCPGLTFVAYQSTHTAAQHDPSHSVYLFGDETTFHAHVLHRRSRNLATPKRELPRKVYPPSTSVVPALLVPKGMPRPASKHGGTPASLPVPRQLA